jgi:hypothetical protein
MAASMLCGSRHSVSTLVQYVCAVHPPRHNESVRGGRCEQQSRCASPRAGIASAQRRCHSHRFTRRPGSAWRARTTPPTFSVTAPSVALACASSKAVIPGAMMLSALVPGSARIAHVSAHQAQRRAAQEAQSAKHYAATRTPFGSLGSARNMAACCRHVTSPAAPGLRPPPGGVVQRMRNIIALVDRLVLLGRRADVHGYAGMTSAVQSTRVPCGSQRILRAYTRWSRARTILCRARVVRERARRRRCGRVTPREKDHLCGVLAARCAPGEAMGGWSSLCFRWWVDSQWLRFSINCTPRVARGPCGRCTPGTRTTP